MKKNSIFIIFALGLFSFSSQAQIKLNNISAGVSYWNRSYEGANETAFFMSSEGEDNFTKGGLMPHLGAELNLYGGLALDGRVGFWTSDFQETSQFGDLIVDESIDQTIIPLSLGLLYRFNDLALQDFNLFAGAGINRYFIQNEVTRDISGGSGVYASEKFSGNNYGANLKAGLEYYFAYNWGVALETRYNTGFYNQSFQPQSGADLQKEQVSVRGLELGLSLRYRFAGGTPEPEEVEALEIDEEL